VITFAQGVLTTRGTVLSNGAPFIVGENGFGTMNLLPGQHTFGDGLVVGYNGGIGIGSVVLSGGTVNAQSLYVTNDMYSFFTFDSGTLVSGTTRVDNGVPFVVGNGTDAATFGANGGQHTFINGLTMSANSTLAGTGTVVGAITSAGIIGPGFSAGQLDVQGDLTQQPGSILSLEIGGTQQGIDYDFLNITGSGYLTGQVEIALLNGFVPSPANVFTSVYASVDLVGSFDNLVDGRLTTLGGDGSFLVSFATGGSGYLMFEDFIASLAAVPEPSVLVLLLGGALVVRWARKRRR